RLPKRPKSFLMAPWLWTFVEFREHRESEGIQGFRGLVILTALVVSQKRKHEFAPAGCLGVAGTRADMLDGAGLRLHVTGRNGVLEAVFESAIDASHRKRIVKRVVPRLLDGVTKKRDRSVRSDEIVARETGAVGLNDVAFGNASPFVEVSGRQRKRISRQRRAVQRRRSGNSRRRLAAGLDDRRAQQDLGVKILADLVNELQRVGKGFGDMLCEDGWRIRRSATPTGCFVAGAGLAVDGYTAPLEEVLEQDRGVVSRFFDGEDELSRRGGRR